MVTIFGFFPHWTLRSSWGTTIRPSFLLFSGPNVSYCCWGAPLLFCCVTVNTSNTVQLLTLGTPKCVCTTLWDDSYYLLHPARSSAEENFEKSYMYM